NEILVPQGYDMSDTKTWGTMPPKGAIAREFLALHWSSNHDGCLEVIRLMMETRPDEFLKELEFEIVKAGGPRVVDCRCNACMFALLLATPEQICRAAVEACK